MSVTEWDMFLIGTIEVPTHIEPVLKPICIPNLSIAKLVLKQYVELVCVLAINLIIPPNVIKQHLFEICGRDDH